MAGILDRYGIKEVADVTFYKLDNNGFPQYPVLYLDTLKVSTIEQTADEATANGGKGNPPLVIWDYNKDITVTLEDALFSAKSLAIMFGDGTLKPIKKANGTEKRYIMKTETFICKMSGHPKNGDYDTGWVENYVDPNGKSHLKENPKFFDEYGNAKGTEDTAELVSGQKYFCTYDLAVEGSVVEISANSFPGTYYVTGDTFARSDISGEDEFFQFIIPKAKVQSENTITLEADGDPSTFNMSLHVMRPENGKMMMLVKYNAEEGNTVATEANADIYHNHYLNNVNTGYEGVGDRGNETGELRFKSTPIRSRYAFANLDAYDGLELEVYDADTKTWSTPEGSITAYTTAGSTSLNLGAQDVAVYYKVAGDDHRTATITLLGASSDLDVGTGD